MPKSPTQLDAEVAEALRARRWREQVDREDAERRARLERSATAPSPEKLYEEYQSDLAAGVFHGEQRGRARDFRRGHAARKQMPDAVRAAIEAGVRATIRGMYTRHGVHVGREPCLTVGVITDHLRQAHMPEDFRYATKDRQRQWTRTVLESLRRRGEIGSSLGSRSRCYEPRAPVRE